MRNIIKTALIVGSLTSSVFAFADDMKKPVPAPTPAKKDDATAKKTETPAKVDAKKTETPAKTDAKKTETPAKADKMAPAATK